MKISSDCYQLSKEPLAEIEFTISESWSNGFVDFFLSFAKIQIV